jgi:hypothetical protein
VRHGLFSAYQLRSGQFLAHLGGSLSPVIATVTIGMSVLSARSQALPTLDVRPVCRGIASQSADPLGAGLKTTVEQCVNGEHDVRVQLEREWSTLSPTDKQHCVSLATTGGESSYTELLTCLEMARDVRALRSAPSTPTRVDATKKSASSPSLPTPRQTPSDKTPQSTAEPSASERTEPKKEVKFIANASEALAQHKLADLEAAVQQVKEETGRATAETYSRYLTFVPLLALLVAGYLFRWVSSAFREKA